MIFGTEQGGLLNLSNVLHSNNGIIFPRKKKNKIEEAPNYHTSTFVSHTPHYFFQMTKFPAQNHLPEYPNSSGNTQYLVKS